MNDFENAPQPPQKPPPPPPEPIQIGDLVNPFVLFDKDQTPYVTYITLGIIIAIYLITWQGGEIGDTLFFAGASYGPAIIAGEWWRLFTSMFLHASVSHIAFNGYALAVLGADMERIYGWKRYLAIYILSGLYGSFLSFAYRGVEQYSVGASGAIFGILGVSLGFFLFYRDKLGKFGRARFSSMLRVAGLNLVIGFAIVRIDNAAHVGGLIAGFALGYLLAPRHYLTQHPPDLQTEDRGALSYTWWVVLMATILFGALISSALAFWSAV